MTKIFFFLSQDQKLLAKETIFKDYMAEGVSRIPIEDGPIRGTLFLPPGPGPFKGTVTGQKVHQIDRLLE